MKHISLQEKSRTPSTVSFVISAQTHRGTNFGGDNSNGYDAQNGVSLVSDSHPEICGHVLYVRGTDKSCDNLELTTTMAYFESYKVAIKEYTEKYNNATTILSRRDHFIMAAMQSLNERILLEDLTIQAEKAIKFADAVMAEADK